VKRIILLSLLISVASIAAYGQTCTGSQTLLTKHVYHPDRLVEQKGCVTVKGIVRWKKAQPDGDIHYRLEVTSPGDDWVNKKNIDGFLVFEPVCMSKIKPKKNGQLNKPALAACKGFHQTFKLPNKGDKVEITGIHMLDKDHGWLEIHPVTAIKIQ
jgi:hypothetical protein